MSNQLSPSQLDLVDINWVVGQIGWNFPTWISKDLHQNLFAGDDEGNKLVQMFNSLGLAIEKAFIADTVGESVKFKYWTKLTYKATKLKPTTLKATLYKHPDYDKIWCLVEYA